MEKIIKLNNAEITIDKLKVVVKGKKGTLEKDLSSPLFNNYIKIESVDGSVKVSSSKDNRKIKAAVGMFAAMIQTLAKGVAEGYEQKLKIVYMHFPVTVKVSGKEVLITNFLGEKAGRKADIIGDAKVEIKGDEITVTGISKEDVGQTSGNMEIATRIKARDRRVYQDGIFKV